MSVLELAQLGPLNTWESNAVYSTVAILLLILLCFLIYCCCGFRRKGTRKIGEGAPLLPSQNYTQKLKDLLANGKIVILHTSKGPKKVKFSLQKNEVRWETIDMVANKKYKLDLSGVLFVYEGKSTRNLVKVNVSEKLCVSLISLSSTLDLQAEREDEQVIMFRGFAEIVESIKKTGSYV
jgi:hypothetical protein